MDEFVSYARDILSINLSISQQSAFEIYERELIDWNTRHNLTAISDPKAIRIKHFLDSLSCSLALENTQTDRIADIGTGAGFPGLPLKILDPAVHLTLVESVGKKTAFCEHICRKLGYHQVEILQERAEAVGHFPNLREQFDWAVARAVAALPILVEYLLPIVRIGGRALAMKGANGPAEVQAAKPGMELLGGHFKQLIPVTLPGVEEERYLIVIEKVSATPERFPRRVGIPAKRPLGTNN